MSAPLDFSSKEFIGKLSRNAVAKGKEDAFACEALASTAMRTEEAVFNEVAAVKDNASEEEGAEVEADEGDIVQAINTMIAKTQLTGIYNRDQRNRELQKIRRYYSKIKELLSTEEYRGLKSSRAEKRTYVTPPVTS